MTAIPLHGGYWDRETGVGITRRYIEFIHTNFYVNVASICRHPKLIIYYTDWHNVDEDMVTLVYHGGSWSYDIQAGVTYRDTDETPTITYDFVAPVQKKNKQDLLTLR